MPSQKFAFQQLEVYQVAKAVTQLTIEQRQLWGELPGGVGERLATATTNLLAEIAAGAAQGQRTEQRKHYQAARACNSQAMSCLEVAQLHGVLPAALKTTLAQQLARIDTMLAGMIRRRAT